MIKAGFAIFYDMETENGVGLLIQAQNPQAAVRVLL